MGGQSHNCEILLQVSRTGFLLTYWTFPILLQPLLNHLTLKRVSTDCNHEGILHQLLRDGAEQFFRDFLHFSIHLLKLHSPIFTFFSFFISFFMSSMPFALHLRLLLLFSLFSFFLQLRFFQLFLLFLLSLLLKSFFCFLSSLSFPACLLFLNFNIGFNTVAFGMHLFNFSFSAFVYSIFQMFLNLIQVSLLQCMSKFLHSFFRISFIKSLLLFFSFFLKLSFFLIIDNFFIDFFNSMTFNFNLISFRQGLSFLQIFLAFFIHFYFFDFSFDKFFKLRLFFVFILSGIFLMPGIPFRFFRIFVFIFISIPSSSLPFDIFLDDV